MPHLDGDCFEAFLDELRRAYPEDEIVVVLDRAGRISGEVTWPEGMSPLFLPARSPELDPAERWFREIRGVLSNVAHATLDVLAEAVTGALRPYWDDPRRLAQLTGTRGGLLQRGLS